jgi:hypothetical protein
MQHRSGARRDQSERNKIIECCTQRRVCLRLFAYGRLDAVQNVSINKKVHQKFFGFSSDSWMNLVAVSECWHSGQSCSENAGNHMEYDFFLGTSYFL